MAPIGGCRFPRSGPWRSAAVPPACAGNMGCTVTTGCLFLTQEDRQALPAASRKYAKTARPSVLRSSRSGRRSAGPQRVRPAVGCLRRSRPGTMRAVLVYGCFAASGPAGARHRVVFGAPGCAGACWLNGLDRPCSAARARASAGSAAAVDSGPSGGAPHAGHFSRLLACAACRPSACWKASSTAAGRNSVPAPSGGTSQRRCPAARSGGGTVSHAPVPR